ncbi:MAG TPA: ELWxxDGT repeat protein [Methylomirabilota bacterium]|jgi:ELWxxDGT repeat protein|nr:ELWxxDGT repeat protein [Methylomirabilota bacterium]
MLSRPTRFEAVVLVVLLVAQFGLPGIGLAALPPRAVLVKDINPGLPNSVPTDITAVGGTAFFAANDGSTGIELWKSDGSAAGTVRVRDINPGPGSSVPQELTNVNGTLFFAATDGVNGLELWKSNGTEAGTVLVKNIQAGAASSSPHNLTNVNGVLFFAADDGTSGVELWKSDGTETGTVIVKHINLGGNSSPDHLTNVNGTLFFTAFNPSTGTELWKSDGSDGGTAVVKDIVVGAGSSSPDNLVNVNGTLFFTADESVNGRELWKSNGSETGTTIVKNINPGAASSSPHDLVDVNGTLFFGATEPTNGDELWKSNGTDTGTTLVKNINPGAASSSPHDLVNVNGTLFFGATEPTNGDELWKSNGTDTGTVLVRNIGPGASSSSPGGLTNVDGVLYFAATNESGRELWRSTGTTAGTALVTDINPGSGSSNPLELTNLQGTLVFQANDGTSGIELWTVQVDNILVTGAGRGGGPHVRSFHAESGAGDLSFFAFATTFRGGVTVAAADLNSDGVPDLITGAGPGGTPEVRIYDGRTSALIRNFLAYAEGFTGGVFVAAGDVSGDGVADIVTGPGQGGGPQVRAFDGVSGAMIRNFFAYDTTFTGGVTVAAGDVNGDGVADIVTGAATGSPQVRVFDGVSGTSLRSFFAYDPRFNGGVFVATGDVNGDGKADIITGAGAGGGPHVRVFDGGTGVEIRGFFAYDPRFRGGVRVAAGFINGDNKADVITGAGPGGGPHVRVFDGPTGTPIRSFFPYDSRFTGGVFVAASTVP